MKLTLSAIVCVVLAACAQGERVDGDGQDRQGDALQHIQQHPNAPVCSGGALRCLSHIRTDVTKLATPSGFGPSELASAYKLDTSLAGGTIAIVDAFDYPNAESDLAAYRSQYGLPACTSASGCFRRVNQNGQSSPLPGSAPAGDDWT